MKPRLNSAFVLIAFLLAGCATQKQAIPPRLTIIDQPQIGEDRVAELGETLVQKGKVYGYDAVRLENSVSAGDGFLLKKFSLEPGILRATMRDNDRLYYTTHRLAVYDALLGTQMHYGGLAISHKDPNDVKFHWNGRPALTPKPTPILAKTQV